MIGVEVAVASIDRGRAVGADDERKAGGQIERKLVAAAGSLEAGLAPS